MTGILAAGLGSGRNILYSPGLVQQIYAGYAGTDTAWFDSRTPISTTIITSPASFSSSSSASISVLWRGFLLTPLAGTNTFSLTVFLNDASNFNYLWIDSPALGGYTAANALIVGSGSGSRALLQSQYLPIRLQMAYDGDGGFFDSPFINFSMQVNGSSSYPLFYNSITTGQ